MLLTYCPMPCMSSRSHSTNSTDSTQLHFMQSTPLLSIPLQSILNCAPPNPLYAMHELSIAFAPHPNPCALRVPTSVMCGLPSPCTMPPPYTQTRTPSSACVTCRVCGYFSGMPNPLQHTQGISHAQWSFEFDMPTPLQRAQGILHAQLPFQLQHAQIPLPAFICTTTQAQCVGVL